MNKYGEALETAKDSANDFLKFIRSIEMILEKPKKFKNKIIGQMKAHFLNDNEKVEEKYIGVIKQMIKDYIHFDNEKDTKIAEGREEYKKLLEVLKEKYKIWNEIYKKEFDKDEVEINEEIRRLNEEFEKFKRAYENAYNLIETKTLASPSHKGSRRRGSREFSIGSNEEIRSTMSGEVSVYSHNSNESGREEILFF
uniref:Uncharacterized protein n=1 Tax=Meloidogyne javanica TaxID=6303 RepID=A0A915LRH3_MELJA